ncbi:acyl-CoA dehydrogenase family protein [Acuticoccus mangrovi]|uniref:Acyl-CoA dehydrogenase family protein n=1 Tax=Acuticoccus mangrovi TaxID=2796142 RepID=A0A934IR00_9HYPH|nr:acyl-CoA dehydrogenase family protein [Acuticoccus mangrovi]MBJ3776460.1 acyl-CoA dehydrogenase family protein [Acuticoccus mangrovi]
MDFELTEDQRIFRDTVRRFAENELADGAAERAAADHFPREIAERFAEMGLLGITIPEADGGSGGGLIEAILAIQAVAEVCPRSGDVVQAGNFGPIRTFAEYATAEQKARFLPDLLAGRTLISLGMTEPDAGSAVTELKTSAREEGDEVVINGAKIFGTHSAEASVFLVYVRFGPGVGGIGSVLVERDAPGFTVGKPSAFMNGEEWAPLFFDECRIPKKNVLLGAGGFKKQISGFNVERLGNASRAVAVGRHAFEVARQHAATRKQFGRPLCEFQGLQWKFAEMAVKLESAQLLLMRAAVVAAEGLPDAHQTAMAKLACNEAGFFAANEALQVMGGLGFSEESTVQYCLRRTRGWMIAGGSIEILKNRIAEGIFERRFSQRPPKPEAAA